MRLARSLGWLAVVLSTVLAGTGAQAHDREDTATVDRPPPPTGAIQRPTRQDVSPELPTARDTWARRPRHVNERYVRDLGNGCNYVATVRGSMQPRIPLHARHPESSYRTDLTLDAHVECRGHVQATAPMFRLRRGRISEAELRQTLASRGRIATAAGGNRTCAYTPAFVVAENRLETRAVWQSCSVTPAVIGGGPRK
jgi:hypothetical protein